MYIKNRKYKKNIIFIGYRQTGKTKTINSLLNEKYETVPTLEPYEINYNNLLIKEELYNKDYIFKNDNKYYFFLKDSKDIIKTKKNIDIVFVIYKKINEEKKDKNIIYLDEDPFKIKLYL